MHRTKTQASIKGYNAYVPETMTRSFVRNYDASQRLEQLRKREFSLWSSQDQADLTAAEQHLNAGTLSETDLVRLLTVTIGERIAKRPELYAEQFPDLWEALHSDPEIRAAFSWNGKTIRIPRHNRASIRPSLQTEIQSLQPAMITTAQHIGRGLAEFLLQDTFLATSPSIRRHRDLAHQSSQKPVFHEKPTLKKKHTVLAPDSGRIHVTLLHDGPFDKKPTKSAANFRYLAPLIGTPGFPIQSLVTIDHAPSHHRSTDGFVRSFTLLSPHGGAAAVLQHLFQTKRYTSLFDDNITNHLSFPGGHYLKYDLVPHTHFKTAHQRIVSEPHLTKKSEILNPVILLHYLGALGAESYHPNIEPNLRSTLQAAQLR